MARLIDAEALKSYMDECSKDSRFRVYYGYAESFINDAPTIDAAPVVGVEIVSIMVMKMVNCSVQMGCYSRDAKCTTI